MNVRVRLLLLAVAVVGLSMPATAQSHLDGQVYSQLYGLENRQAEKQWDFYQGLMLRFRPAGADGLSIRTNLRVARRGDPGEWDESIYNAYLDYRPKAARYAFRAGRQFLYRGVVTGSVDGVSIEAFPRQGLQLQVVGGFAVPFDRSLDLQNWDEGGVLGAYGRYQVSPSTRVTASYLSRRRGGQVAWHQAGASVSGRLNVPVYYQARFEYNLEASTLQGMRYRIVFAPQTWSFSGEFVNQKPRVYEDSFFNIFELEAFSQVRAGASYRTDRLEAGLQFVHTMFSEDESTDEFFATLALGPGSVGVVYKTGFGGDNTGVFGDLEFDLLKNLSARLRSSYYTYERRSATFSEDATSFSGGFLYRPVTYIVLRAELQQSMNSAFDDDLRLFLRASYQINRR